MLGQSLMQGAEIQATSGGASSLPTLVAQLLSGYKDPTEKIKEGDTPFYKIEDYQYIAASLFSIITPEQFYQQLLTGFEKSKDKKSYLANSALFLHCLFSADVTHEFHEQHLLHFEKFVSTVAKDRAAITLPSFKKILQLRDAVKSPIDVVAHTAAQPVEADGYDYIRAINFCKSDAERQQLVVNFAADLKQRQLRYFKKLPITNFHGQAWTKAARKAQQQGESALLPLNHVVEQFNKISSLIQTDILNADGIIAQQKIARFYVDVLEECLKKGDFNSAFAISAALQSTPVKRLNYLLDDAQNKKLADLEEKISVDSNSRNLRAQMNDFRVKQQFYIPFVGIFLTDLTFTDDGSPDEVEGKAGKKLNSNKLTVTGKILNSLLEVLAGSAKQALEPYHTDIAKRLSHPEYLLSESAAMQKSFLAKPRLITLDANASILAIRQQLNALIGHEAMIHSFSLKIGKEEFKNKAAYNKILNMVSHQLSTNSGEETKLAANEIADCILKITQSKGEIRKTAREIQSKAKSNQPHLAASPKLSVQLVAVKHIGEVPTEQASLVAQLLTGFRDPRETTNNIVSKYQIDDYHSLALGLLGRLPVRDIVTQLSEGYQKLNEPGHQDIYLHNAEIFIKELIAVDNKNEFTAKLKEELAHFYPLIKNIESVFQKNVEQAFESSQKEWQYHNQQLAVINNLAGGAEDLDSYLSSLQRKRRIFTQLITNVPDRKTLEVVSDPFKQSVHAKKIADDLKTMYLSHLLSLNLSDFHRQAWEKNEKKDLAANRYIELTNKISAMVTNDILNAKTMSQQERIYALYIQVLEQSIANEDYASAMAINSALNSASITRLNYLQENAEFQDRLKRCVDFCDPSNRFKNIREAQVARVQKGEVCIPFIGYLLSDLSSINENPNKHSITEKDDEFKLRKEGGTFEFLRLAQLNALSHIPSGYRTNIAERVSRSVVLGDVELYTYSLANKPRAIELTSQVDVKKLYRELAPLMQHEGTLLYLELKVDGKILSQKAAYKFLLKVLTNHLTTTDIEGMQALGAIKRFVETTVKNNKLYKGKIADSVIRINEFLTANEKLLDEALAKKNILDNLIKDYARALLEYGITNKTSQANVQREAIEKFAKECEKDSNVLIFGVAKKAISLLEDVDKIKKLAAAYEEVVKQLSSLEKLNSSSLATLVKLRTSHNGLLAALNSLKTSEQTGIVNLVQGIAINNQAAENLSQVLKEKLARLKNEYQQLKASNSLQVTVRLKAIQELVKVLSHDNDPEIKAAADSLIKDMFDKDWQESEVKTQLAEEFAYLQTAVSLYAKLEVFGDRRLLEKRIEEILQTITVLENNHPHLNELMRKEYAAQFAKLPQVKATYEQYKQQYMLEEKSLPLKELLARESRHVAFQAQRGVDILIASSTAENYQMVANFMVKHGVSALNGVQRHFVVIDKNKSDIYENLIKEYCRLITSKFIEQPERYEHELERLMNVSDDKSKKIAMNTIQEILQAKLTQDKVSLLELSHKLNRNASPVLSKVIDTITGETQRRSSLTLLQHSQKENVKQEENQAKIAVKENTAGASKNIKKGLFALLTKNFKSKKPRNKEENDHSPKPKLPGDRKR